MNEEIRPCVLVLAKNEEVFLDEWINHHLELGFERIFIIDNNDFSNALKIDNENVTIIPFNGVEFGWFWGGTIQLDAYNYALSYIKETKYNYVMIVDVDEFLAFHSYDNVKDFIKNEMIDKEQNIAEIVWETYDDNNIIWEKDTKPSVVETYTHKQNKMQPYCFHCNQASWSKCIVKIYGTLRYSNSHWPAQDLFDDGTYKANHIDHNIAIIKHYRTKCLETYVRHKLMKTNLEMGLGSYFLNIIDFYFSFNEITKEKINAFKKIFHDYGIYGYDEQLDQELKEFTST